MDYNQQRQPRSSYGYRRPMNQQGAMSNGRGDCGCRMAPNQEGERRSVPREKDCDRKGEPMRSECSCGGEKRSSTMGMDSFELAMAYVPWQRWNRTYDAHRALMSGTIFPELDKPFCGAGRCSR